MTRVRTAATHSHGFADEGDWKKREVDQHGSIVAGYQRSQRTHLEAGFPLCECSDGKTDPEAGQVFTQAAHKDFAEQDDYSRVEPPTRQTSPGRPGA